MGRLSNRARSADRVSPRAWSDGRFTIDDMVELFAEAFLESLQEPDHQEPEHRYDEDRSLCVLADGRVYVEHAAVGDTQTSTKAVGEHDDRDDDIITEVRGEGDLFSVAADGTHTAIRGEADDWAATRKDTETVTLVDSEGIDWAPLPQLDTLTRIRAEADDWSS